MTIENPTPIPSINPEIHQVLNKYPEVFRKPKELPPIKNHKHKIVLQEGKPHISKAVKVPPLPKNEIEKLVKELLDLGFVRPNQTSFFSPVLLVKKADGNWRLCIDYKLLLRISIIFQ